MSLKHDRMNERIQVILSELLRREVSDPRLHNITVTDVRLDGEMMYADIYVNALGDESRSTEVLSGLQSAKGFLRRELGQRIRTRNTPELHFHWDATLEEAERLNQLIDKLEIPSDEELKDE